MIASGSALPMRTLRAPGPPTSTTALGSTGKRAAPIQRRSRRVDDPRRGRTQGAGRFASRRNGVMFAATIKTVEATLDGEAAAIAGPHDPELRKAPAAFRTVVKLCTENWCYGRLIFVLPSGREIRIEGEEPGPEARLIVNDFRFISRVLSAG